MTGVDKRIRALMGAAVALGCSILFIWILWKFGTDEDKGLDAGALVILYLLINTLLILADMVKVVITGRSFEVIDKRFHKEDCRNPR